MSRLSNSYPEELLHWIWQTSHIKRECLLTADKEPVTIFDPGKPNNADGPDFLNAHIQIGDLAWYGDVEIHWSTKDWKVHGHHTDRNYNRVILHVVWHQSTRKDAKREDNSSIPTLVLRDHVPSALYEFIQAYHSPDRLPCSGNFSYISRDAFLQQLRKAKRQYFEQKVNDLLAYWDPSLNPSGAWQRMLAVGLFDGLGISHNRFAMRRLCAALIQEMKYVQTASELVELALSKASVSAEDSGWNHKGSRPANHPETRIVQGASLLWFIYSEPFNKWLNNDVEILWNQLGAQTGGKKLGQQRRDILFGTVWLPSLYILGNTFFSKILKTKALKLWEKHEPKVPSSLLKPFKSLGVPPSIYRNSLGSVYQLRTYCKPRHCNRCKVFKSIISS